MGSIPPPAPLILAYIRAKPSLSRNCCVTEFGVFGLLPLLRFARKGFGSLEPWRPIQSHRVAANRNSGYETRRALRRAVHGNFGALYPVYVRGEAYLALHRGAEAVSEFQKSWIIVGSLSAIRSAPSHICSSARAYAQSGDTAKARTKYREFHFMENPLTPTFLS